MYEFNFDTFLNNFYIQFFTKLELYTPKVFFAFVTLFFGILLSIVTYKLTLHIYHYFKIDDVLNKIELNPTSPIEETITPNTKRKIVKRLKLTERISLDTLVAKAFSYYIFLVFFRFSIVIIGIHEVESFLSDLLSYLPSLFVGILIGFFGINFSDTVYDVVYHTLELTKQKTGKVIAMGAKIIILFFTIMLVLNYIQIVDQFIINTFIVGFVSAFSLGIAIAFGLGGRDVAHEILESFKK